MCFKLLLLESSFYLFISDAKIDISILKIQITLEFSNLQCHHDAGNKTRLCKENQVEETRLQFLNFLLSPVLFQLPSDFLKTLSKDLYQ